MKNKAEEINKKPKEQQEQLKHILNQNMQRGMLNQNAATSPFGYSMVNQAYQNYNPMPIMQPAFSYFPQPSYGGGGMMPAYQNPGMQRGYPPNQMNMGPAPVPQAINPYGFGQMGPQAPFPGFGGGYGGYGGGFGGGYNGFGGGYNGFGGGYRGW